MAEKLICPVCEAPLKLTIAFSGCDWDTVAGNDSGYDYPISLDCTNDHCARSYTLGHINEGFAFSPVVPERQPYTEAIGFIAKRALDNKLKKRF